MHSSNIYEARFFIFTMQGFNVYNAKFKEHYANVYDCELYGRYDHSIAPQMEISMHDLFGKQMRAARHGTLVFDPPSTNY